MDKEKKIIIGVSGGPDSMFLADFLEKNFGKEKLLIAHFNHKFRKESDVEEKKLKKYFTERGIEFVSGSYNGKDFKENSLRKARYNFFKSIGWGKYYLALGHNLTDRIETSFINLARGAGLKGFLNMKVLDKRRKIYRPLLNLEKSYIQKRCDEEKIPYFIDKTNFDPKISKRNFIRNEIFPLLEELGSNFFKNFAKLYEQIENIIPQINIKEHLTKIEENIYKLKVPKENQEFFIREILDYFGVYDFRSNVIKEIIDYIENARGGGFKKYGNLCIFKKGKNIYIGLNLSIEKIKEIGQKKYKS